MVKKKEILRLHFEGVVQRDICDVLGCGRNIVSQTIQATRTIGLDWEVLAKLSEDDIRQLLFPKTPLSTGYTVPDFEKVHREIHKPGINLKLAWDEYRRDCTDAERPPYQYSQFCKLYEKWCRSTGATMRLNHRPAEKIEIDWVGDTGAVIDSTTGEIIDAFLFVACLPYSQYLYVEAFSDMKQQAWTDAHIHTFEYFGGVPRFLVPDNCKTGVIRSDWYMPTINESYRELAEHYGTAVMPARAKKPRDKGSVENSVKIVETWVLAYLRNEKFFTFKQLNDAIRLRIEELNNKPFQKREGSRTEVFSREEKPELKPLPVTRYELARWRKAKVATDYHIQIDQQRYSIPFSYIGTEVDVRVTSHTVEVFTGGERICSHKRLTGRLNQYSTNEEHMPEAHRKYLEQWNPDRFRRYAEKIGPNTKCVIDAILHSRSVVEQSYRSCIGVLGFSKKVGGEALESACAEAVRLSKQPSYTQVRNILAAQKRKPDKAAKQMEIEDMATIGESGLVRGADYYRMDKI